MSGGYHDTPPTKKEIAWARETYCGDDINIDDDAKGSRADDGLWVQAWVWVPNDRSET